MIMEDLVDSGDDSKIGDSDSINSCSTSSSIFTDSESESNDEIALDQLPWKRVRTRGRLAFRPTQNLTATAAVSRQQLQLQIHLQVQINGKSNQTSWNNSTLLVFLV